MKHFPNKYALVILILISLLSCKHRDKTPSMIITNHQLFDEEIMNFSKGVIPADQAIFILFKNVVADSDEIGKTIENPIFNFDPPLSGKAKWVSGSKLLFEHEGMQYGQTYQVNADLANYLSTRGNGSSEFRFGFSTIPLLYEVNWEGLSPMKGEKDQMTFSGEIEINYPVAEDKIEKLLSISSGNYKIEWQHIENKHAFIVSNIQREQSIYKLKFKVLGNVIGAVGEEEYEISIPPKNSFYLLNAKTQANVVNQFELVFSNDLFPNQAFQQLILIKNNSQKLRFTHEKNKLIVYTDGMLNGEITVKVSADLKDNYGEKLTGNIERNLHFGYIKPAVKLLGKGNIVPRSSAFEFPFKAVNLEAVDVEISKVYSNNILQFLQHGQLSDDYLTNEVSKIIWQGKVNLTKINNSSNVNKWQNYGFDVNEFIQLDPGAIYNITIGFKPGYIIYDRCTEGNQQIFEEVGLVKSDRAFQKPYKSIWKSWYYYDDYSWSQKDNPCYPLYYTSRNFVRRSFISSDIGVVAKYDKDKNLQVCVRDLVSAEAISNAEISVYTYQQQLIETHQTNDNGIWSSNNIKDAHFIMVKHAKGFAYLSLKSRNVLSLSEFDVGGQKQYNEISGYIYGERGVWRPGDSLFLNFVLRDEMNELPLYHPITFKLITPRGALYSKKTILHRTGSIYDLTCKTDVNAPTGNWRAIVKMGGQSFEKTVKIETVQPNRLKIIPDIPDRDIRLDEQLNFQVNWLHGAPANALRFKVDARIQSMTTTIKDLNDWVFDDPARKFQSKKWTVFDQKLDQDGRAAVPFKVANNNLFPGKLKVAFNFRAFEKGGNFSTDATLGIISPFKRYVGINFPKTAWGSYRLPVNETIEVNAILVDEEGVPLSNKTLNIGLYIANWRWWWDSSDDNIANYNAGSHEKAYKKFELKTNAKGLVKIPIKVADYGAYMLRVCDEEGGHCSGIKFYSGWRQGGDNGNDFASKLKFSTTKEKYNLNEMVQLQIPCGKGSQVLVSLESEGSIIKNEWIKSDKEILTYTFKANEKMAPNIYAHVLSLRPINDAREGMPIRQYGVLPIRVEDPRTILDLTLKAPKEIKPNANYRVSVKNNNKETIAYTLAVVDEGLLDLTRFKTPDLHQLFYGKRALAAFTWDMYNDVFSTIEGGIDKIISIGGDGNVQLSPPKQAQRFKPVVTHLGPFELSAGKTAKHNLHMGNYTGAVRVMVVAAGQNAYGKSEQSIKVKQELMMLVTAPRVISPLEEMELPVTVFAHDKKIKAVTVSYKAMDDIWEPIGPQTKQVVFTRPGEKLVYFRMRVKNKEGIGKIEVTTKGNGNTLRQVIEMNVSNPNPTMKQVAHVVLEPKASKTLDISSIGIKGTNETQIEISRIPDLNLEKHMRYLMRYPYGCVEQTTSSVFPQLFLSSLMDLSAERTAKIDSNITAGIQRLVVFQLSNGALSYWLGGSGSSEWGSIYAAHFLLLAKEAGYETDYILQNLIPYLSRTSRNGAGQSRYAKTYQAYRLMVLALAGKPDISSMNILKNISDLSYLDRWYLAYAYALINEKSTAISMLKASDTNILPYRNTGYTYGSDQRDLSLLLVVYMALDMQKEAHVLAHKLIKTFGSNQWFSTQTRAYYLYGISNYLGGENLKKKSEYWSFSLSTGSDFNEVQTDKASFNMTLKERDLLNSPVQLLNTSKEKVFVTVNRFGKPSEIIRKPDRQVLRLQLDYVDAENKAIDITNLKQGTDFYALIKVSQDGRRYLQELVLNHIFPSGWEILNTRLSEVNESEKFIDYQDIRDDRVISFFDLRYGNQSLTIKVPLNAAYKGKFYHPETLIEAMYDNEIFARLPAKWVRVE